MPPPAILRENSGLTTLSGVVSAIYGAIIFVFAPFYRRILIQLVAQLLIGGKLAPKCGNYEETNRHHRIRSWRLDQWNAAGPPVIRGHDPREGPRSGRAKRLH